MNRIGRLFAILATVAVLSTVAFALMNYFQGFETGTGDWVASKGASGINSVPSGGGALHLTASSGNSYAELQNLHDGYQAGYGDGGYSFYGGKDATYHGDFYQAIDVYIDTNWAPAALPYSESFWIDMTPYHTDPNNYGAEHNFHIKALGGSVSVSVDNLAPIASLTNAGWYTFVMTWRKATNATDPVITDMMVFDHSGHQVASTTLSANSPGGPFASADLLGTGYVWITLWQNGFANDVLAIDNQRSGLLPFKPLAAVYSCKGFQTPFDAPISLKSNVQRAIPLKAQLLNGQTVASSSNIVGAPPVVNLTFLPGGSTTAQNVSNDLLAPVGQSTDGNVFTYDATSGSWVFNLSTKSLSATGTYTVSMVPGDSSYVLANPCSNSFTRLQ